MPMTNLSPAFTNPMTMDRFMVVRRIQEVDDHGRLQTTNKIFSRVFGVVASAGGNSGERSSDEMHMEKNLSIITKFKIIGPSDNPKKDGIEYAPDIIFWPIRHGAKANQYLVTELDDYAAYGPGFVQVKCQSKITIDFTPQGY